MTITDAFVALLIGGFVVIGVVASIYLVTTVLDSLRADGIGVETARPESPHDWPDASLDETADTVPIEAPTVRLTPRFDPTGGP